MSRMAFWYLMGLVVILACAAFLYLELIYS